MAETIELETPRLRMRCWRDADREPYARLCADAQVMRHFPRPLERHQADADIDAWLEQFANRGWSNWALELKHSGECIGFTGLSVPRRPLPFSPCVEIGWRLARAHWHQGYATEAASAALACGFERLGLEEIVSFTSELNAPSLAVMERLGMQRADADFDHPALPEGHVLRRHRLYRISQARWRAQRQARPHAAHSTGGPAA